MAILSLIDEDDRITTEAIHAQIGASIPTINRDFAFLKKEIYLNRFGGKSVCKYIRKKKNEKASKGKEVYLRIHREPGIECGYRGRGPPETSYCEAMTPNTVGGAGMKRKARNGVPPASHTHPYKRRGQLIFESAS